MSSLVSKGLVVSTGKYSAKYRALPMEVGLGKYFESVSEKFRKVLQNKEVDFLGGPFNFITSRAEYHRVGERLFKEVRKEVLVIASGTGDLSADFTKVMVDAVQVGVVYKILALTLGEVNRDQLENWKKNGFLVRYKQGENINLVIYDREIIQMGFRLEPDSREKIGILIQNETLGKFLGEFYDYLWESARESTRGSAREKVPWKCRDCSIEPSLR